MIVSSEASKGEGGDTRQSKYDDKPDWILHEKRAPLLVIEIGDGLAGAVPSTATQTR
jgi:hypothetical protein